MSGNPDPWADYPEPASPKDPWADYPEPKVPQKPAPVPPYKQETVSALPPQSSLGALWKSFTSPYGKYRNEIAGAYKKAWYSMPAMATELTNLVTQGIADPIIAGAAKEGIQLGFLKSAKDFMELPAEHWSKDVQDAEQQMQDAQLYSAPTGLGARVAGAGITGLVNTVPPVAKGAVIAADLPEGAGGLVTGMIINAALEAVRQGKDPKEAAKEVASQALPLLVMGGFGELGGPMSKIGRGASSVAGFQAGALASGMLENKQQTPEEALSTLAQSVPFGALAMRGSPKAVPDWSVRPKTGALVEGPPPQEINLSKRIAEATAPLALPEATTKAVSPPAEAPTAPPAAPEVPEAATTTSAAVSPPVEAPTAPPAVPEAEPQKPGIKFSHLSAAQDAFAEFSLEKAGTGEGAKIDRPENLRLSRLGINVIEQPPEPAVPGENADLARNLYGPLTAPEGGQVHEVTGRLDLKPEEILDRDAPLTPEQVQRSGGMVKDGATGQDLIDAVERRIGSNVDAERRIYQKMGFRAMAQSAEETLGQTRKFIAFDPKDAKIESHVFYDENGKATKKFGPGAASIGEAAPVRPFVTSLRKSVVNMEREQAGRKPLPDPVTRSDEQLRADAKQALEDDSSLATKILADIAERPRPLFDNEVYVLLEAKTSLIKDRHAADVRREEARKSGDVDAMRQAKQQSDYYEDQIFKGGEIISHAATETARGLRAMGAAMKQDYTQAALDYRMRKDLGGQPLTESQKALNATMAKAIANVTDTLIQLKEQAATEGEQATQVFADAVHKIAKKPVKQLEAQVKPGMTPKEKAIAAREHRLSQRIVDIKDKIARGDFTIRLRKLLPTSAKIQLAEAQLARLKEMWRQKKRDMERASRPWWIKALDKGARFVRAGALSSPVVLLKLATATTTGIVFHPLDEMASSIFRRVVPGAAGKASIEGQGLSISAYAKALAQALIRGPKDALDMLRKSKGHMSDLDALYSHYDRISGALELFGIFHGAEKAFLKRFYFTYAMEQQIKWALEHDLDPLDPLLQMKMGQNAYIYANRGLFLEDNRLSTAWSRSLGAWRQPSKETGRQTLVAMGVEAGSRALLPVTKVGTNIINQTFERIFGIVPGSLRAARAYKNGIENLRPEEAELILRQLKRGSVGGVFFTMGLCMPEVFGGMYTQGERRKKADVAAGEMRTPVGDFPRSTLHHPLWEVAQVGATIRHVYQDQAKHNASLTMPIFSGLFGLAGENPFISEAERLGRTLEPRQQGGVVGATARGFIEPQFMQWTAKQLDRRAKAGTFLGEVTPRRPKTVVQQLEMGIPGLRQKVPKRQPKGNKNIW